MPYGILNRQSVEGMSETLQNAPVAQSDRVFGYEPKGRGFESLRARHRKLCSSEYGLHNFFFTMHIKSNWTVSELLSLKKT